MEKLQQNTLDQNKRVKLVRLASVIALVGNTLLCIAKLWIGFSISTLSIVGDGIDSAGDVGIAIMSLVVSFVIIKPSDKKFPWGRQRAETIASLILAFIIMFAGLQLFITAFKKILAVYNNELEILLPHYLGLVITGVSIAVKLLLALSQYHIGKKTQSLMVQANAKNMTNDIILSASVLIGLFISLIFKSPIIDPIIALLVSIWIFTSGIDIFIEVNIELMDGQVNVELYRKLFTAIASVENVHNPHRARIRKMGSLLDIDVDIEIDANLTVYEAHILAEKVTTEIKKKIENVYDIMIHIEPYGIDNDEEEGFGLRENDL